MANRISDIINRWRDEHIDAATTLINELFQLEFAMDASERAEFLKQANNLHDELLRHLRLILGTSSWEQDFLPHIRSLIGATVAFCNQFTGYLRSIPEGTNASDQSGGPCDELESLVGEMNNAFNEIAQLQQVREQTDAEET